MPPRLPPEHSDRNLPQQQVRFLIDKDGKIVEAVVVNAKELHTAVVEEALRVILGSPKWNPGYQLGKPVRSYRTQPLTFSVSPE